MKTDKKGQYPILRQQREAVYHCVRCGACHTVCPTYQATGDEAQAARGRMRLVEAVLDGELELTRGFAARLSRCAGCMACETACPSGVSVQDIILAAKAEILTARHNGRAARLALHAAARGSGEPGAAARLAGRLGEALYNKAPGNPVLPWWRDGARRSLPALSKTTLSSQVGDLSPLPGASSRVALFPGCAANLAYTDTGLAAIRLLHASGMEVAHPRGLQCCGLPYLSLGDREAARRAAAANLELLAGQDVDAVVTVCSSCGMMLKKHLPELLGRDREDVAALAGAVTDIHELLRDHTTPPVAERELGKKVTWHDPCHMRHGLGVTTAPRDIISRLDGVEYIDLDPGCCGGAGAFSFLHYDLALKIGASRAESIAATGANIVATGCPGCRLHLTDVLRRAGSEARVVHTVELLAVDS